MPPVAPDDAFLDGSLRDWIDSIIGWAGSIFGLPIRGDVSHWYAAVYPDLEYLYWEANIIDPDDPSSTARIFSEAGPMAYGEIMYILHPSYITLVDRVRIELHVKADGPNPMAELELHNWDGTLKGRATFDDAPNIPGQPGWKRLRVDASRDEDFPFGEFYDHFTIRMRDTDSGTFIVRGIRPRADVDASGSVDAQDAQAILSNVGATDPGGDDGDVNGDGVVDAQDLDEVIQNVDP
ncbi:MAG: dockerin type I domain-containing protein [Planctomycetota bacterium]